MKFSLTKINVKYTIDMAKKDCPLGQRTEGANLLQMSSTCLIPRKTSAARKKYSGNSLARLLYMIFSTWFSNLLAVIKTLLTLETLQEGQTGDGIQISLKRMFSTMVNSPPLSITDLPRIYTETNIPFPKAPRATEDNGNEDKVVVLRGEHGTTFQTHTTLSPLRALTTSTRCSISFWTWRGI